MSSRIPRINTGRADDAPNVFLTPALACSMWNPFLAGFLRGNAQAHEGFAMVAGEWQDFLARRLKEDFALMKRLTHCSTPDQVMAAYADFWHKAADDYGREITTMSKLVTGVTTKMVAAAQAVTDEADTDVFRPRQAA
jgi:hypothetical protein